MPVSFNSYIVFTLKKWYSLESLQKTSNSTCNCPITIFFHFFPLTLCNWRLMQHLNSAFPRLPLKQVENKRISREHCSTNSESSFLDLPFQSHLLSLSWNETDQLNTHCPQQLNILNKSCMCEWSIILRP